MVEVEVGRDDVAHFTRAKAQICDLAQSSLRDLEFRPGHRIEQESEPLGIAHVLDPKTRIDEDQPVLAFDQQAVAAHCR